MIIYIVLLLMVLLNFKLIKNKKHALLLTFICITAVACLREYTVGVDTPLFYIEYTNIGQATTWDYNIFRYEKGFFYLCKIMYLISKNPQTLIIITSLFINLSVYKFIKEHSENYFLSTILYIILNIFFSYMNIMREAIAIAILLHGYKYLINKNNVKYFIIVLLAIQFHVAAYAAFLLLLVNIIPKKKWVIYVSLIVAIVLFLNYKQLFQLLGNTFGYYGYANTVYGESNYFGALLYFIENFLIILLCNSYAIKSYGKDFFKERNVFILTMIAVIYLCFSLLIMRMNIFNRISSVFYIYVIIYVPKMLEIIREKSANNAKILSNLTIFIYLASFIVISIYRPNWYGCIPYNFFF